MMVFNLQNIKKFLFFISVPLIAGFIGSLFGGSTDIYSTVNVPNFAPPSFLFPIVWTILYILMGISAYLISTSGNKNADMSMKVYYAQLLLNVLWPLIFFRLRLFLIAWLWIIVLIILVGYMIYLFYKIDKTAGILQIPYLLWLIFASILSFAILYKMQ